MYIKYKNSAGILFQARLKAAATNSKLRSRESTAEEFFNISPETLKCYENGTIPAPEDFIFQASEVYGDPLIITDCFNQTRIGQYIKKTYGFSVEREDLKGATLSLVSEFNEIYDTRLKEFIRAASDGMIDGLEKKSVDEFADELGRVIERSAKVIYLTKYGDKAKTAVAAAVCG
jgi:hypothetical protein